MLVAWPFGLVFLLSHVLLKDKRGCHGHAMSLIWLQQPLGMTLRGDCVCFKTV